MAIVLGAAAVSTGNSRAAQNPASTAAPPECRGERCDAVARGRTAFVARHLPGLSGNGRSCADCHMPSDHFQLSPASVERRWQELQTRLASDPGADDPLFRPIDADDFRTNGVWASDFRNLRENGLIRIVFPLPPNMRVVDPLTNQPSTEWSVDVWRMVPSVNDVALTGPDEINPWPRGPNSTGGYQLDARLATLQEQAHGALVNHAEVLGVPSARLLDDLAAFQLTLFTNERVRALARAVADGVSPLPDPDPPLTPFEQEGKAVFERACAHCHGGPGGSTPTPPVIRFFDIRTQCPRPVDTVVPARWQFVPCSERLARNATTYEITLINGTTARRTSSDPGRALLTGFVGGPAAQDDWNKLDIPGLRGISRTAPYFHNNSAATLDEVVDHYIEFFKFVRTQVPPGAALPPIISTDGITFDRSPLPEEREALLVYLLRL